MKRYSGRLKAVLRTSTALLGLAALMAAPSHAIVGNDAYPPSTLVDTANVTGVGQMVIDQQNGYIGLCTATLINPRTVIFAAHCVNEGDTDFKDASTYGAKFGGTPIAFFFNANNNVRGNSAIGHWLNGTATSDPYQTNTSEYAYNSNYVVYNKLSTSLGLGNNFLEGDIALAALDTPATDIPTWTLLFSPLTEATHATVVGYGRNGTGTTGSSGGIDYRRRVAENMISVLGSLDDLDVGLGSSREGLPQNLYLADFNDPKYGTSDASVYDFNIFHDAALAKEGITASGDSGGPLIVDQLYKKQVVAAVLSGGSWFFDNQPSSSYGTTSFYQPLYLYWDWIVTNNPYKYVSAKAGDGAWTDPAHWVINIDPNYAIAASGDLVNALPSTPAQGVPAEDGINTPKFGQICSPNLSCYDVASDTTSPRTSTSANKSASPDVVSASTVSSDNAAAATSLMNNALSSIVSSQAARVAAEGSATINGVSIQGAPGSSNFVPNDTDGDPTTGAPARYYDVTLSAAGTTTLANASVLIDRLTIAGASSALVIAQTGALGTYIDTTMYGGSFRVDGIYASVGDIALVGGLLSGSGLVTAPYITAVKGAIAPGTVGTVGTLTIGGNLVLSSGSALFADVSASASDLLDVYGEANLGGTLLVSPVNSYVPKWHDAKTVLQANTITGAFDSVPDTIAGVLYPTVKTVTIGTGADAYQAEVVTFEAASFTTQLPSLTADQTGTAKLLDSDRADHYETLSAVYDAIDPLSGDTLGKALESLAPDAARALPKITQLFTDAYTGYIWQHLGGFVSEGEAKVAVQTDALKLAENSKVGSVEMRSLLSNLSGMDNGTASPKPAESGMSLPKGVGAFLSGQKLDGTVTIGGDGGKADVDGFLIALGADIPVSPHFRAGLSFGIGEAEASLKDEPAATKFSVKQAVVYGQYTTDRGYFVGGYLGGLIQTMNTHRQVTLGSTMFNLNGHAHGSSGMFGVQTGLTVDNLLYGTFKPAIGLQYGLPRVSGYSETGGAAAMSIGAYENEEVDFRFGFDAQWKVEVENTVLKPNLHLFSVNNLGRQPDPLTAGFAAVPETTSSFALARSARNWAELGVGVASDVYDNTALEFHFNANPGRGDSSYTGFGGSLKVKF